MPYTLRVLTSSVIFRGGSNKSRVPVSWVIFLEHTRCQELQPDKLPACLNSLPTTLFFQTGHWVGPADFANGKRKVLVKCALWFLHVISFVPGWVLSKTSAVQDRTNALKDFQVRPDPNFCQLAHSSISFAWCYGCGDCVTHVQRVGERLVHFYHLFFPLLFSRLCCTKLNGGTITPPHCFD